MRTISAFFPTYNETENIEATVREAEGSYGQSLTAMTVLNGCSFAMDLTS